MNFFFWNPSKLSGMSCTAPFALGSWQDVERSFVKASVQAVGVSEATPKTLFVRAPRPLEHKSLH